MAVWVGRSREGWGRLGATEVALWLFLRVASCCWREVIVDN